MSSQIHVNLVGPGEVEVVADSFGGFISSFSDRLSQDGVLLEGAPQLEPGAEVKLRFALDDGFLLLSATGRVSERTVDGLLVPFLSVDEGQQVLAKMVDDHVASGGTAFRIDEVEAPSEPTPEVVEVESEPPAEVSTPSEPEEDPEAIQGLLDDAQAPAFAPGMDRLDGEGQQERKALDELAAAQSGRDSPLNDLGRSATEPAPVSETPEPEPFRLDGEAQSELDAALEALEEPSAESPAIEPEQAPEASSDPVVAPPVQDSTEPASQVVEPAEPSTPPAAPTETRDLADLSDEEFADEIDDALDSAFGPSTPVEAPEAADASTRLIDLSEIESIAAPEEPAAEAPDSEQMASAADEVADLLGAEDPTVPLADESSAAVDLDDLELTPEPPPQLDSPDLADLLTESEEASELVGDRALPEDDEASVTSEASDVLESTLLDDPSLSVSEVSPDPAKEPSQLEMPSLEELEASSEEVVSSRPGLLRGLIPLLLLALIGVGAWRVADLVRQEFSRLEEDRAPAARVPLEEDDDVLAAPSDSVLALQSAEDGPTVTVDVDPALPPATLLENVTWSSGDEGTVVTFAGNGAFSAADTALLRLNGNRPRVVIKIGGMQQAYYANQLPLRTDDVDQLRFGLHLGAVRNEIHVVFDLTGRSVEVREIRLSSRRLEIVLD